jgi:predicted nuclease of predicted toxin-antitoxin system
MKLLIDQNISHRIIHKATYPDAVHVRDLNLHDKNDPEIFMFARKRGYHAIVTLDEDFSFLLQSHGIPPKIVWLRTGNCSTSELAKVLLAKQSEILQFIESEQHDCMEIFK